MPHARAAHPQQEHLLEEETTALPLMRAKLTQKASPHPLSCPLAAAWSSVPTPLSSARSDGASCSGRTRTSSVIIFPRSRRPASLHLPTASLPEIPTAAAAASIDHHVQSFAQDLAEPMKILLKNAKPSEFGYMMRCKGRDEAAKRKFMAQEGIPGPVQTLIMLPACRKEEQKARARAGARWLRASALPRSAPAALLAPLVPVAVSLCGCETSVGDGEKPAPADECAVSLLPFRSGRS